jgi:hypothetical protein
MRPVHPRIVLVRERNAIPRPPARLHRLPHHLSDQYIAPILVSLAVRSLWRSAVHNATTDFGESIAQAVPVCAIHVLILTAEYGPH